MGMEELDDYTKSMRNQAKPMNDRQVSCRQFALWCFSHNQLSCCQGRFNRSSMTGLSTDDCQRLEYLFYNSISMAT
jgi:hypothetical protein